MVFHNRLIVLACGLVIGFISLTNHGQLYLAYAGGHTVTGNGETDIIGAVVANPIDYTDNITLEGYNFNQDLDIYNWNSKLLGKIPVGGSEQFNVSDFPGQQVWFAPGNIEGTIQNVTPQASYYVYLDGQESNVSSYYSQYQATVYDFDNFAHYHIALETQQTCSPLYPLYGEQPAN